jgi:hypothetical protein
MKTLALLFCALLLYALPAGAQTGKDLPVAQKNAVPRAAAADASPGDKKIDPAKEKDIRRLMELSGAKDRMSQVMTEMERNIRPMMEQALPAGDYRARLVDAFFVKFHSKADLEQLVGLAVPAYDRHFSHEEIKGLIGFYQTPLGKKITSATPELMSEMMSAGQKWGEELGRSSMLEVLTEHPEFEKAIEEAQNGSPAQAPQ